MEPRGRERQAERSRWLPAALIALAWASVGCRTENVTVAVSLLETKVQAGRNINIKVVGAPEGWSGQVSVENAKFFTIDAARKSVRASIRNGFVTGRPTDLFVLLTDHNGLEIPLRDRGHLQVQVLATQVSLVPDGEEVSSGANQGEIRVTAPSQFRWSVKNVPAWMTIGEGAGGAGDGTISWRAAANTTRQPRSATLEIGDAAFEMIQLPEKEAIPSFAPSRGGIPQMSNPTSPVRNAQALASTAKIAFDRKTVRLGEEIQIAADKVPAGWFGEITVNSRRTFKIDASSHTLRATLRNGFNERGPTSFYVQLFDLHGKEIPLPNNGLLSMDVTPTAVTLDRDSRNAEADGALGELFVRAKDGFEWSVTGVPSWIKITAGLQGSGPGMVSYRVERNNTSETRKANLLIGDAFFQIVQSRSPLIELPFHENFDYTTPPRLVGLVSHSKSLSTDDSADRWILDDQPGLVSTALISPEAPQGGNSLLFQKPKADPRSWANQLELWGLAAEEGPAYRVSVWMKAQPPGMVSLTFGQRTEPFANCGLSRKFNVSGDWAEYAIAFKVAGRNCEAENNRLSFEVGQIAGKLWIANLAIEPSPAPKASHD